MSSYGFERRLLAGIRYARGFTKTSIDRRVLMEIIEMARWAPSIGNIQPWEVIIVDDPIQINKLTRMHPSGRLFSNASALFIVVANPESTPHYLIDAGSLLAYLALASSISGLDIMIIPLNNDPVIKAELNIPPKLYLAGMIAVGRRAPTTTPLIMPRKPIHNIIHYNKYGLKH